MCFFEILAMTDSLSDIPSSGASDELKTTKTRSLWLPKRERNVP
jgi:hypothetical protein